MHEEVLTTSMRTTNSINKLVVTAQEEIEKGKPNEFLHPDYLIAKEASLIQDKNKKTQRNQKSTKSKLVTPEKTSLTNNQTSTAELNSTTNDQTSDPDLDHSFRILSSEKSGRSRITQTEFSFLGGSIPGHGIEGNKPTLINFTEMCDAVSLTAVLEHETVVKEKKEKCVILCFDIQKCNLVRKALTCLNVRYLTYTPALTPHTNNISDQNNIIKMFDKEYSVLISDFKGISGLEFKNVIVCVESEEHYLRQLVVDSISRCTCNLVILHFNKTVKVSSKRSPLKLVQTMRNVFTKKPEKVNLSSVVNKWREADLVREIQVSSCDCNLKELYCFNESSINIHQMSDKYQQMMKICDQVSEVQSTEFGQKYIDICKKYVDYLMLPFLTSIYIHI